MTKSAEPQPPSIPAWDPENYLPSRRLGGFTQRKKVQFLNRLAQCGNVRQTCDEIGVSAETAYLARRRDEAFAAGWKAALALALDVAEQELAERACFGVEEAVWHRGQVAGYRTKFDNRLFLAHLARLDKVAEDKEAQAHAARFDELLAVVGGEACPEDLAVETDPLLPASRELYLRLADPKRRTAAARAWDDWRARSTAVVDAALDSAPVLEFKSMLRSGRKRTSRDFRSGLCQMASGC